MICLLSKHSDTFAVFPNPETVNVSALFLPHLQSARRKPDET